MIRICVLTPVYGDPEKARVAARYAGALYALSNDLDVMCGEASWRGPKITIEPTGFHSSDVVIARSELVKRFLAWRPHYTHALWWDEDVIGTVPQISKLIVAMVRLERDAVGVPYPQKRLDFGHAVKTIYQIFGTYGDDDLTSDLLEALVTPHYAYNLLAEPLDVDAQDCAEVPFMPLGFSLWRREAFERMVAHYADSLSYRRWIYDDAGRATLADDPTVALFALRHEGGELDSEDFSFCSRYRAIGGKLSLYLGEGSPLNHVGAHVFRGSPLAVRRR
jgi:hypothetical protein